ncbi:hypothetical protein [Burkholderia cepacia]|uniref:hypothetical protein n=1 Tax=Burkholderia cepacia TaxID=292 RepID=UPI00075A2D49|nr:hypothetical protein [Burkholderia cepacia]KVH29601.1 hypothetical protein WS88_34670 [Burkholderia cepacia]
MKQGSYPIGSRTLQPNDTLTGVVTGATADVPMSAVLQYLNTNFFPALVGSIRPAAPILGQLFIDLTLGPNGQLIYCAQISPVVWCNTAGIQV